MSGMTPIYRASSTLLIETQQAMPMNLDELIGIDTTNSEYYQTQFEVLKSRKLAKRVMEEMNLYEHREWFRASDKLLVGNNTVELPAPPISVTENPAFSPQIDAIDAMEAEPIERQMAVNRFMKRVSITPIKNTKLVRIGFESDDPVLAARIANKIADTYILSYMDSRMEMSEKATTWLASRLTDLKIKLEESQNNPVSYTHLTLPTKRIV